MATSAFVIMEDRVDQHIREYPDSCSACYKVERNTANNTTLMTRMPSNLAAVRHLPPSMANRESTMILAV
jgi:hypothetical protein